MNQISDALDTLTCELIGEAIGMLEGEGILPVLLMTDAEGGFCAFEDDTPDGCYRAACMKVQELGASCTRYAIAYDGVVQESESDAGSPAILVEFAERDQGPAWSGYLLYRRADDGFVEVTDPLPAGEEEPLFA